MSEYIKYLLWGLVIANLLYILFILIRRKKNTPQVEKTKPTNHTDEILFTPPSHAPQQKIQWTDEKIHRPEKERTRQNSKKNPNQMILSDLDDGIFSDQKPS